MPYRTGRLPHDPGRVAAQLRHIMGAVPMQWPARTAIPFQPDAYGNETLSDCTVAGLANAMRSLSWVRNGCDLAVASPSVIGWFTAAAAPNSAEDCPGLVTLDVLERAATIGFDLGQQVRYCPTATVVDITDRELLMDAARTCGSAYVGVDLTPADLVEPYNWIAAPAVEPAEGHLINLWDCTGFRDDDIVSVVSWGLILPATWTWLDARLREAYAVHWRQISD